MTDRTIVILAALGMASVGASMVWRPGRYYVVPGRETPDETIEPPRKFKTAVRTVGAVCMVVGAGLMALVFLKIRSYANIQSK